MKCPYCPNGKGELISKLGRLRWYKCDKCGRTFNSSRRSSRTNDEQPSKTGDT